MKLSRTNVPFTQIANEILYRSSLSLKAKGLYAYLFSKPPDWDFAAERIAIECKEERKTILATLKELEKSGLLKRNRLSSGRVEYHIGYGEEPDRLTGTLFTTPQESLSTKKAPRQKGTVQKWHGAEIVPVSNTYSDTNTEVESNIGRTPSQIAKSFFSGGPELQITIDAYSQRAPVELVEREIRKFVSFWTEPNKSGTKARWEQQPTFEVKRRLATWFNNIKARGFSGSPKLVNI